MIPDAHKEVVTSLLAIEEGLTEWELFFVEHLGKQVLDEQRPLTNSQLKKGEEILFRLEK